MQAVRGDWMQLVVELETVQNPSCLRPGQAVFIKVLIQGVVIAW